MDVVFAAIVAVGTLATIVGLVGLALGTRSRNDAQLERTVAARRRKTLMELVNTRSFSPR